jgi:hypothetical protein
VEYKYDCGAAVTVVVKRYCFDIHHLPVDMAAIFGSGDTAVKAQMEIQKVIGSTLTAAGSLYLGRDSH